MQYVERLRYSSNMTYRHDMEYRYVSSKLKTYIVCISILLLFLLFVGIVWIKIYFSTTITKIGYEINKLTHEKITLLEERERLKAEYAYLFSPSNIKKIANDQIQLKQIETKDLRKP